jgi:hypothetical protein
LAEVRYRVMGLDRWLNAVDYKRFNVLLKKNMGPATAQNSEYVRKHLRERLQRGVNPQNAPLTVFIKNKNHSLVDTGDLLRRLTSKDLNPLSAFVGIINGTKGYELAQALVEGATIPVSEEMRGLFFYLWLASTGKIDASKLTGRAAELYNRRSESGSGWRTRGWKPLSPGTSVIQIPGRDFVSPVFNSKRVQKVVQNNWEMALAKTFEMMARR